MSTARYALVGAPIDGSPSPAMHNAAFRELGLDARYELRPTGLADLATLRDELARGVWAGLNVTTPLKAVMCEGLALDATASRAGAVNTLWRDGGAWAGALTDVDGVRRPLLERGVGREDGGVVRAGALVLGAGGAAKAAVLALAQLGFRVSVAARRPEAARAAVEIAPSERRGSAHSLTELADMSLPSELRVLVQATPVGRGGEAHALRWGTVPRQAVAFEMLYRPRRTPFLAAASGKGLTVVEGWEMLLEQGVRALEKWTGKEAPRAVMAEALRDALAR